jgi:hypothetical protein
MRRFFIGHEGRQLGPYAESDIPSMLKHGQIQPETLCWTDGMAQWQSVGEVFGQAANPQPESPPVVWNPEWAFHAEVGLVFKSVLDISPDGILLNKPPRYPLHDITRVRWGGTRTYTNGICFGTEWQIWIGNEDSDTCVVFTRNDDIFSAFIGKLMQAVVMRLFCETLQTVCMNRDISFSDAILHDDGMTLHKFRWFKANEPMRFVWDELSTESSDGSLVISGRRGNESATAHLSYKNEWNIHILDMIIDLVRQNDARRLSDLL